QGRAGEGGSVTPIETHVEVPGDVRDPRVNRSVRGLALEDHRRRVAVVDGDVIEHRGPTTNDVAGRGTVSPACRDSQGATVRLEGADRVFDRIGHGRTPQGVRPRQAGPRAGGRVMGTATGDEAEMSDGRDYRRA